jgi:FkbM family methyltransferase
MMISAALTKGKVKIGYWNESFRDWRDSRDLRALNRFVRPHNYASLRFASPTRSLKTEMLRGPDREEETRRWIESIPQDGSATLWDIGANVGSFTIFAASLGIPVVAIEPMPHNILLLTKNIVLNNLQDRVVVIPMAVSNRPATATLSMSSLQFGSAGHGFGTDQMFRGRVKEVSPAAFQTVGMSIDTVVEVFCLPSPSHLKVDVDGIDDEVIYGSSSVLMETQSICCEMKLDNPRCELLIHFLESHGFQLQHRTRRNGFFYRTR